MRYIADATGERNVSRAGGRQAKRMALADVVKGQRVIQFLAEISDRAIPHLGNVASQVAPD